MENVAASFSRVKVLIILVFCSMYGNLYSPLPHNMNLWSGFLKKIGFKSI